MDAEVAAAAQAGHWSDPCEVCMWHTGTTSRGADRLHKGTGMTVFGF